MVLLELENVNYTSDTKTILKDINLSIEKGDFISITGPSGSGKSTLLKLISSLLSPTEGIMKFMDKNINDINPVELRKKIVYCFQTPYFFGNTVIENISFPYEVRNLKPNQERINDLFKQFGIPPDFLHREVKNLSGGEKQRISLIRSIVFKPEVLLLDEITSALDTENTIIIEDIINSIHKEGTTVLWVTHNPEQSRKYAGKLLTLEAGAITSQEVIK